MIYKSSYFNKELKEAYNEDSISRKNSIVFGCVLAVVTMAIHLMMQPLRETVMVEWYPEILSNNCFSVVFLFNYIAMLFFMGYVTVNSKMLTFQEVGNNKWYPLIKNGYSPTKMTTYKLLARFFRLLIVYSIGFVGCLLVCALLKYRIVLHYLLALYATGIADIMLVYTITLALSNFIKKSRFIGLLVLAVYIIVRLGQYFSGFYQAVRNVELMKNFWNLFAMPHGIYFFCSMALFVLAIVATYLFVKKKSSHFSMTKIKQVKYYIDYKNNSLNRTDGVVRKKVVNIVVTTVILILAVVLLVFDASVLLMTVMDDFSLGNTKPILFKSTTLVPTIQKNDITFFKKVDNDYNVQISDIVMFEYEGKEYIQRIIVDKGDGTYITDITNYENSTPGSSIKTIGRRDIIAVYVNANRTLGVLVTFASSFVGRIVMVIIPLILLLYRKQIVEFFSRQRNQDEEDNDSDIHDKVEEE